MPPEPITVSVKAAAEMTGLSRWTIYQLLDNGDVASVYKGSRRLVLVESLRDYIANLPTERPEVSA
jgi:excisionase family DNA binding protein